MKKIRQPTPYGNPVSYLAYSHPRDDSLTITVSQNYVSWGATAPPTEREKAAFKFIEDGNYNNLSFTIPIEKIFS